MYEVKNRLIALMIVLLGVVGCGNEQKHHEVQGTIVYVDGDVQQLSGHLIELAAVNDQNQRASGAIDSQGRFKLETLDRGELRPGVPPGEYVARLIIVDEGDGQLKKPKVAAKYLQFQTAGWKVQVPNAGDSVQFTITRQ